MTGPFHECAAFVAGVLAELGVVPVRICEADDGDMGFYLSKPEHQSSYVDAQADGPVVVVSKRPGAPVKVREVERSDLASAINEVVAA